MNLLQKNYKLFLIIVFSLAGGSMISASDLELYVLPQCPYCHKVQQYIEKKNIQGIQIKNIQDPKNKEELISIGGKKQVPCLVHNKQALYESDEIIKWLKHHCKPN